MTSGMDKVNIAIKEALRRMYKIAIPPADIDKIIASGEGKMEGFFMAYYLPQEVQDKIVKEVIKEYKIDKQYRGTISASVFLGASPNSCLARQRQERKDYKKRLKAFLKK